MKLKTIFSLLIFSLIFLIILNLEVGDSEIGFLNLFQSSSNNNDGLIIQYRFYKIIAAILTGIALPLSGFLLQELFRNPLAGPSVFGITSASGLGVAIVIFLFGTLGFSSLINNVWVLSVSAFVGALLALFVILFFAKRIKSVSALIVVGFMIAGFSAALISVMQFYSNSSELQSYIIWGFGSLSGLTTSQILAFCLFTVLGLVLSFFCLKGLTAMQLGETYAESLGIKLNNLKFLVILSSAILTAAATAFVGPISFIGLAIPHICRTILKDYSLNQLFLFVAITGTVFMLLFMFIAQMIPNGGLPINIITVLFGAPIVISILMKPKTL